MSNPPGTGFSVTTLAGERVLLRPFLAEDAPAIRAVLQDPEVGRLTGMDHGPAERRPWDEAAEERMRAWYSTRQEQRDRLDLAVVDRATGAYLGEVVLIERDGGNQSCSFRIALAEAKTGFVAEGVLRDALRYDGAWVDVIVMSILAPEWKRHHGHPESVPRSG